MAAAANGHGDIVEILLNRGAEVNEKTESGVTVLMVAKKGGHTEIVELLKQAGAKE